MTLNVVFREFKEDSETYFVAECRELPGCVSEGSTRNEAGENIKEAIKLCISVILEDSMARTTEPLTEIENVISQSTFHLNAETEFEYA